MTEHFDFPALPSRPPTEVTPAQDEGFGYQLCVLGTGRTPEHPTALRDPDSGNVFVFEHGRWHHAKLFIDEEKMEEEGWDVEKAIEDGERLPMALYIKDSRVPGEYRRTRMRDVDPLPA